LRVVLDTNVLVSALVGHGRPRRLLIRLLEEHEIVSSKQMLAELGDVLSRRRIGFTRSQVNDFLLILVRGSTLATIVDCPEIVAEDPDDDMVVATALEGRAEYIVSGDRHLLGLKEFRGIRVVTVGEMLDILEEK
jgi:putative PIN family toxin of toxin-antitoxin system